MVLVIAFGYWTYLARIVRSLVLSLKEPSSSQQRALWASATSKS